MSYPGNVNNPAPPPQTVSCPYCTLLLTVPAGAPIIRCPACNNTSAITLVQRLQMNCFRCHTLLSYMQNYSVIQCPQCGLAMAPPTMHGPVMMAPPAISHGPAYTVPTGGQGLKPNVHSVPPPPQVPNQHPNPSHEGTFVQMPPDNQSKSSSSAASSSSSALKTAAPTQPNRTTPPDDVKLPDHGDYSSVSSKDAAAKRIVNDSEASSSSSSSSTHPKPRTKGWNPFGTRRSHDVSEEFTSIDDIPLAPYTRLDSSRSIN